MPEIIPIIDADAPYREFKLSDVYTGPSGTGRWVPNVDDSVWDWASGIRYRITAVNYSTGLSTLTPYVPPAGSNSALEEDLLLGSGPGSQSESYRVYVNTDTLPYRLAFDARLRVYGSTAKELRLFRGVDISEETGLVVSAMFDQDDNLISDTIPLVVEQGAVIIKVPVTGYSTEALVDGEVVTAVFYDTNGVVISYSKLLVKNTAFIRSSNAALKTITSITLVTPWISESDNALVQIPLNLPLSSLVLMGRVTYSDGSSVMYPIDGTKFSLPGINTYVATVVGQRADLVLTYRLAADEYSLAVQDNNGYRFITEEYAIETVAVDGSYSVKIFTYPVWNSGGSSYSLKHFLYNLDRDFIFEIDEHIEPGINSDIYNSTLYGDAQNLVFAVDLEEVDVYFNNFRYVQSTEIILLNEGSTKTSVSGDKWIVNFTPGGGDYGQDVIALAEYNSGASEWEFDITCGETVLQDWLEKVYHAVEPLRNPASELVAPTPDRFTIRIGEWSQQHLLSDWDTTITGPQLLNISQGDTIFIEWELIAGDKKLAISAMTIDDITA